MEEEYEREIERIVDLRTKTIEENLLKTQRNLSGLMVAYIRLLSKVINPKYADIETELIKESSEAIREIKESIEPLNIANAFWDK